MRAISLVQPVERLVDNVVSSEAILMAADTPVVRQQRRM
jgi:hypothetical protein